MDKAELKKFCLNIQNIIDTTFPPKGRTKKEQILEYYLKSAFLYKAVHSRQGAMHMPVEFSSQTPHAKKLLYQPGTVHELINQFDYYEILELGCGMGFNSNYLAQKNPEKNFTGFDLTTNNIKIAKKKATGLSNINYKQKNFDEINPVGKKYDLIFAVETLCYSQNIIGLLAILKNRLNKNGRIIIFDGYKKPKAATLEGIEKQAFDLMLWGYALDDLTNIDHIRSSLKLKNIFSCEATDFSSNVLPNLKRFQNGSNRVLSYPKLMSVLLKTRIISPVYFKQLVAGLFSFYLMHNGLTGYFKLEFVKKELAKNNP